MKYLFLFLITFSLVLADEEKQKKQAEVDEAYEFEIVVDVEATQVKNQNKTGTCWTFAGNSFLESELIRMGKGNYNLSEMFIARNMYPEKADNYVRYHGKAQFGQGALAHDVMRCVGKYGIVPDEVYSARPENDYLNHAEMYGILTDLLKRVVSTKSSDRTQNWQKAYVGILDAYMGTPPTKFTFEGKEYTPKSFRDYLSIDPDNYLNISSFTHHPFYEEFILEVPDNFSKGLYYNIKMREMLDLTERALENGYTVNWGGDVSEKGFDSDRGLAINPKDLELMIINKDDIKWDSLYTELEVTQEKRQDDFDTYKTGDDHGMHLTGIVKDKMGRKYFIVKNSWGSEKRGRDGYLYMSYSYFMHKTTAIQVHKDALGDELRGTLGL